MTSTISASAPAMPVPPPRRRTRRPPPSPAALRSRIEAAVDRLIAALDTLDDDPDLEPSVGQAPGGEVDAEADDSDDEPSLGSNEGGSGGTRWGHAGCGHWEVDRELDPSELEPSLAAAENHPDGRAGSYGRGIRRGRDGDQRGWETGATLDDLELDTADDEGSLGACEGQLGTQWSGGSTDELEAETDAGIDDDKGIDDDWFGGSDAELTLGWSANIDQRSLNATDDREPTLGSCNNVSQLAWGASGNDDTEDTSAEEPTEVAALVVGADGNETIARHVGCPLRGLCVIHDAMQAGDVVRQVLFKRVRGNNVGPYDGNLVPIAPGIMRFR